ncbi:Transcriptional activatory protein AadR [bacterium HR39]|nr:Transcriptional activatory protein AadR [bacterium HR39]
MSGREQAACCGRIETCERCGVRGLAVCRVLSPEELRELSRSMRTIELEPGEPLFHEGDPAHSVFTLTGGHLRLSRLLADGRRQVTGFLLPGDFLGLAFRDTYVATAEALDAAVLCTFPRTAFEDFLARHPRFEHELLARARSELAAAQEQMLVLGRKTARERLATFLVQLARRHGTGGRAVLHLPMGRADIADYLGLTVETVSRTFSAFRREGLVRLEGRSTVHIPSLPRLAAEAALE